MGAYLGGRRAALQATLTAAPALSGYKVYLATTQPDVILDNTVVIAGVAAEPPSVATPGAATTSAVWVVVPKQLAEDTEDALETATDAVLTVLDAAGVQWTQAERSAWAETHPAYRIEVVTYG